MPVTIRPSATLPEEWNPRTASAADRPQFTRVHDASHLLYSITTDDNKLDQLSHPSSSSHPHPSLLQSSFPDLTPSHNLHAAKNGLVHTILEAYNNHHNLVLRPDDIWLAILVQLAAYTASRPGGGGDRPATALHIDTGPTAEMDHGRLAEQMAALLSAALSDAGLAAWCLPSFTTSRAADRAAAAAALMGALRRAFVYSWGSRCGIPAVTLLGEERDWEEMLRRGDARLGAGAWGKGPRAWWREVLRPVVEGLVWCFRRPDGEDARRFWRGVCDRHVPDGSGRMEYSGWVTAFCYWDEEGRCLHEGAGGEGPRVSRGMVPMGFARVPVTVYFDGVPVRTEMVAGSVGMRVRRPVEEDAGGGGASRRGGYDTLQPEIGWFLQRV